VQDYHNLDVWRKAHALAVIAYRASIRMHRVHGALAGQLRRSAASIPTNISEGCGHDSPKELARFVGHSCASANEFEYQIRLAKDVGAITPALHRDLEARIREVRRMLVSFRSTLRKASEEK
jgi:four helix bundle protein